MERRYREHVADAALRAGRLAPSSWYIAAEEVSPIPVAEAKRHYRLWAVFRRVIRYG